jgi:phosphoribosylglycinamide formyltransferase 1
MINIAIFASGTGSNALNIHAYFQKHPSIRVNGVYCNNVSAGILQSAPKRGIKTHVFSKSDLRDSSLLKELKRQEIDYIILAGFLWLIPENLLDNFHGKILNIHPALLPHYGGKGMYGMKVHESVIANKESKSGITIHEVNKEYDKGRIVFQAEVVISEEDTPSSLAEKIHKLEHQNFPVVIEQWIMN